MQNNKTLCRFPETLSDARCFTDASNDPDVTHSSPRRAGLGIFFLDPRANNSYYIKLQINNITSVVIAEAATLAFAAAIASALGLQDITFLTDSQMLTNYFNGQNLSCPPFWDAKPFTQKFLNFNANKRSQVLKIPRSRNSTAHSLVSSAFRLFRFYCNQVSYSCTNANHVCSCPLRLALQNVNWEAVSFIAASCC